MVNAIYKCVAPLIFGEFFISYKARHIKVDRILRNWFVQLPSAKVAMQKTKMQMLKKVWLALVVVMSFGVVASTFIYASDTQDLKSPVVKHRTVADSSMHIGEFKLENYKTAEEAQAALLKLHPIGSQTKSLLGEFEQYAKLITHKNSKQENEILIQFKERPSNYAFSKIIETEWVVVIQDRNNTIISITVKKYLTGP